MSAALAVARDDEVAAALEAELIERRTAPSQMGVWLYRYLPAQFFALPGAFHRGIYRDCEDLLWQRPIDGEDRDSVAFAYPRGHGKTTTLTLGLILWICHEWRRMPHFRGKPPFILIVSDTADQARDRALDIRDELEANEALQADYGCLAPSRADQRAAPGARGAKAKWTETDFTLTNGVRIVAKGAGSKVRGMLRRGRRPTLIVCDDLENDEAVGTKERRAKLERWLTKALIPTGIEGEVLTLVVGTILHADSLLSRLLSPDHYDGWLKRRFAALSTDGLPDPEGVDALWPEYWTRVRLLRRRRKIGSVAFAQEYLNQAIDDLSALFRRAWLDAAMERGRGRGFLYAPPPRIPFDQALSTWDGLELSQLAPADAYQLVVTAWDLGLVEDEKDAQRKDSDYAVGLTLCLDAFDRMSVRRVYRKRGMTPAALQARVVAEQSVVGADYVVVENNAAQRIHEIELRGVPGLPVVGHTTDKRKHSVYEGVPGMALQFELGRIDLCWANPREREKLDVLRDELHGLGLEAHDDCVMALWMAVVTTKRWIRVRDARRRRMIGAPPPGYLDPAPTREDRDA